MSYVGYRTCQQKHVHNNQQTYIESVISKIVKNKHLWKTKQSFVPSQAQNYVNIPNNRAI
jgi:hypothetical protein